MTSELLQLFPNLPQLFFDLPQLFSRPDESGHYQPVYDYRKMTRAQRESILAERNARKYPLHKPPHLELGQGWYLITGACFEHRHHFSASNELTALTGRLLEAFANAKLPVAAWVVMPNHYHLLTKLNTAKDAGSAIGPVHGRSGRYVNQRDNVSGRKVWFKYSDRKMRSDRHFWTTIHYIMTNPVKHEFVQNPAEWVWSSYHESIEDRGVEWFRDLQRDYPLREYGVTWDRW
jgi:putative transposase